MNTYLTQHNLQRAFHHLAGRKRARRLNGEDKTFFVWLNRHHKVIVRVGLEEFGGGQAFIAVDAFGRTGDHLLSGWVGGWVEGKRVV